MTGPAEPFAPVLEVASLLLGFARPWFIAGGWAIDQFLRRVTRDHEDIVARWLRPRPATA